MKIAISTESICDLSESLINEFKIYSLPFVVILGDEEKRDGVTASGKDLIEFAEKTKKPVRTAAVSIGEYMEFFKKILEENDEVIHIAPSYTMSCAYQNAKNAAEEFGGKVHVIESRSLCSGMGLLIIYAARLRDKGLSAEEIVAKVEERKLAAKVSLCLETLDFIYRGGRCGALTKYAANILHLHPMIWMKEDGILATGKKFIGPRKRWMLSYVDETLKKFDNPDHELVFLASTIFDEKDQAILDEAKEKLLKLGFKRVEIVKAGATIACHVGRNAIGCIFMNDGDHPVE